MTEDLELQERDVWGDTQQEFATHDSSGSNFGVESDSDDARAADKDEPSRKRVASSSSSSDSELDEQLEQNIKAFRGPAAESLPIGFNPSSHRGRPRSRRESLEENHEHVTSKLGTSMPINIPTLAGRRTRSMDVEEKPDKAATFVPPHLLEQPEARTNLSLSSASGAKREKLLQRNAILRRTGFLEADTRMPGFGKGALPELMDPLNRRMMPIKESHLEQSALSAALGSPNSKASEP